MSTLASKAIYGSFKALSQQLVKLIDLLTQFLTQGLYKFNEYTYVYQIKDFNSELTHFL